MSPGDWFTQIVTEQFTQEDNDLIPEELFDEWEDDFIPEEMYDDWEDFTPAEDDFLLELFDDWE